MHFRYKYIECWRYNQMLNQLWNYVNDKGQDQVNAVEYSNAPRL